MGRSIGIDLGTTNSCMAILDDDQATILANSEGSRTTPSVVAFADDGTVIVGDTAKRQTAVNVDRTFSSIKRHIGTDWTTPPVDGKKLRAQEISARVLQKLKKDAETYLNEEVTDVVITVPAYFDDAQRQATIEAGKIAGLNVLRIINEPTAAAVAYGLDKSKEDEIILVFDLGGGTFDVSLLEVGKADGFSTIQVRSTSGDNELGGDDWDSQIVEWIKNSIAEDFGNGVEYDAAAEVRLKEAAEQAKKDLSNSTTAKISLQYLGSVGNNPCHFDGTLSRDEFEMITADLLDRCRFPFEDAIKEAELDVSDINHVVLVGGSTRMPAVTELVKELTGGKEPNKGVNPDEVVAAGAALQSGVLTNKKKDLLLIDVTPLSLGVETAGGVMNVMIAKNSAIPTSAREVFSTAEDDQDSVEVQVFQGERRLTRDNKHLGTFELTGIPPASRGAPKIEVTFELDANGIVHVSAVDLGTGVKQDTTITGGSALSDTEIKRMINDAEEHSAEDEKEVESLQNLQKAKTLTYTVKKSLDKHEDLPEDIESEVKERLAGLEDAISGGDPELIREASDTLTISQRRIGEWIYGKR